MGTLGTMAVVIGVMAMVIGVMGEVMAGEVTDATGH
jgi:hypothetical protein